MTCVFIFIWFILPYSLKAELLNPSEISSIKTATLKIQKLSTQKSDQKWTLIAQTVEEAIAPSLMVQEIQIRIQEISDKIKKLFQKIRLKSEEKIIFLYEMFENFIDLFQQIEDLIQSVQNIDFSIKGLIQIMKLTKKAFQMVQSHKMWKVYWTHFRKLFYDIKTYYQKEHLSQYFIDVFMDAEIQLDLHDTQSRIHELIQWIHLFLGENTKLHLRSRFSN